MLSPIRKSITVTWPRDVAFRRFTAEIATWWPLRTHSVGESRAETVIIEDRVGGRIYEKIRGGEESTWGIVTIWEPPHRVAFTWHPGQSPDLAQQVEVRFISDGPGTRLELTHSNWERLGKLAKRARRGYPIGWAYVLHLWAGRRNSLLVRSLDVLLWILAPLQRRMAKSLTTSS